MMVDNPTGWRTIPEHERLAGRIGRQAILVAWRHGWVPHSERVVAGLLLTDGRVQRRLNRKFRGIDRSTNVLAFAMPVAESAQISLGEVSLALGTLLREARQQRKSPAAHFCHLVAHGLFHLLGYDHLRRKDAKEMEELERLALASLNIADPYREPLEAR
ncbi:MAG TPA: rRNA maturation RNase YbeY [Dongiaceae bacterium]|jgi:probable rRNA maturation factor|nr:rRNA maturation RNase YbeY [Dongiaceae bacterium]